MFFLQSGPHVSASLPDPLRLEALGDHALDVPAALLPLFCGVRDLPVPNHAPGDAHLRPGVREYGPVHPDGPPLPVLDLMQALHS